MRYLAFSICILWLLPARAQTTEWTTIRGTVLDSFTGEPLPFAQLKLTDSSETVKQVVETNFDGFFEMKNVPGGRYRLVTHVIGYFNDTLQFHKNTAPPDLSILMRPVPLKRTKVIYDNTFIELKEQDNIKKPSKRERRRLEKNRRKSTAVPPGK